MDGGLPDVALPKCAGGDAVLLCEWTVRVRSWRFVLPRGAATDGASIPRALWRVCGHPLESPRVYAALVHDGLYGNAGWCPAGMTRAEADAVYRDLQIGFGISRWRAWTEFCALRLCGSSHWTEREKTDE